MSIMSSGDKQDQSRKLKSTYPHTKNPCKAREWLMDTGEYFCGNIFKRNISKVLSVRKNITLTLEGNI